MNPATLQQSAEIIMEAHAGRRSGFFEAQIGFIHAGFAVVFFMGEMGAASLYNWTALLELYPAWLWGTFSLWLAVTHAVIVSHPGFSHSVHRLALASSGLYFLQLSLRILPELNTAVTTYGVMAAFCLAAAWMLARGERMAQCQ